MRYRSLARLFSLAPLASALALAFVAESVPPSRATASYVVMKDGRILTGSIAPISAVAEDPKAIKKKSDGGLRLILLIHDELRRTFVSKRQIQEVREGDGASAVERFHVRQAVPREGPMVNNVGQIVSIEPFDQFGRRTFKMYTDGGKVVPVIQGITVITPVWTKVEGLTHIWDQRLATSSIPRETLTAILAHNINSADIEQRLKVARLYLQSDRYQDAQRELEQIVADFPERREELEPQLKSLLQLGARRLMMEIKLRRDAGQHRFAAQLVANFPSEGVAGETLGAAREMSEQLQTEEATRTTVLAKIDEHLLALKESDLRQRLGPWRDEINADLGPATLDRLSAYRQLMDDPQMEPGQKIALACSGWLAGSNTSTESLGTAMAMYDLRNLIRDYLAEEVKLDRDRILDQIRSQEGSTPEHVARLISQMKPPWQLPPANPDTPGLYQLSVPAFDGGPDIQYLVQLPPEYDPYRRYPTVVTLHASGTDPALQIDWWAGGRTENGARLGQATRHGYIVIAPAWGKPSQRSYEYSAREHAAVLDSLRDACRRFAVDVDRVYLSGHAMGADAAWDLAIAHPDLWAGAIPISGTTDRYTNLYWENARYVPLYFVGGEMDGDKMIRNARDFDRFLDRGFNATVVEYVGRGHEHFSDEILRIFDWMGRQKRDFFPREFTCNTMRPWDNFFWWIELADQPERTMVDPNNWPLPEYFRRPLQVDAKMTATGGIRVSTGAKRVTVWLAPEMVQFDGQFEINVNNAKLGRQKSNVLPDLVVLLEDVRTRGDRQHPFWAKVELPGGVVNQMAGQ